MAGRLDFRDGAVMVFGGSGGAGSAICRAFADAGCAVALTYYSDGQKAEGVVAELRSKGVAASSHHLDLADAGAVKTVFDAALAEHGSIHTVVYAAGPPFEVIHVCDVTPATFSDIVSVELLGFFHIMHATMPYLRTVAGNVVACVTYANRRVLPNDGQSAAPKAGIESLVRQIAYEEASHGVRANCVALGWLNVGLGAIEANGRSQVQDAIGQEMAEYMANTVPLGRRPGRGEELAAAVLFMASEQASYITGQSLAVDGGATV